MGLPKVYKHAQIINPPNDWDFKMGSDDERLPFEYSSYVPIHFKSICIYFIHQNVIWQKVYALQAPLKVILSLLDRVIY